MKKSELKTLIFEIVQRKLNESNHFGADQVADSVNRIIEEKGSPNAIEILTHHGSDSLKVIEVYHNNGTLYLSVEANPPEKLNELDLSTVDTSAGENGLGDSDKKELANLKSQSDKLTAGIKKIEGDVAKMQTAIQPKMQRWERQKAKLQKQQSDVIRKQQSIQDKA